MKKILFSLLFAALVSFTALAQNGVPPGTTAVQLNNPYYATTPISATAAINTQTTLTIPAPNAGLFNYVCMLKFAAVQDATSTANVLAVTTATNFNSFALKYSLAATADAVYQTDFNFGTPATGCAKNTLAGTATTFVSPAGAANTTYTWYATYYQAP